MRYLFIDSGADLGNGYEIWTEYGYANFLDKGLDPIEMAQDFELNETRMYASEEDGFIATVLEFHTAQEMYEWMKEREFSFNEQLYYQLIPIPTKCPHCNCKN